MSDDAVKRARDVLADAASIVVLSGAGISTDSGIPDFRGPNGLWTTNPDARARASIEHYLEDAALRRRSWTNRLDAPIWAAKPNAGHFALVELDRRGRLSLLATQNTDGLHAAAGQRAEVVVELHGSVHRTRCLSCDAVVPTEAVLQRVRRGEDDPRCQMPVNGEACDGILKVATVSFGQRLDTSDLARAATAVRTTEVLVAVGSTLTVDPVASLVPLAQSSGAAVVIVNGGPTRYDAIADVVVSGSISEVLPAIVA